MPFEEYRNGSACCSNDSVKSLAVVLAVLHLMDLTEVAQLYFQEVVVEAEIQVVEVDSEDKISLEMDFLLAVEGVEAQSLVLENIHVVHTCQQEEGEEKEVLVS